MDNRQKVMIAQDTLSVEYKSNLPSFLYLFFKRAWMAVGLTVILYGILFSAICLDGSMASFGRLLVFGADAASIFRDGFWIISVSVYLIFLVSDGLTLLENSKGWKRLAQLAKDKIERPADQWIKQHHKLSSFFIVCIMVSFVVFLFAVPIVPVNTPKTAVPAMLTRPWHPVDKVLIHLEGYEKNHVHASRNIIWSRNIVGPAKITPLGNGRYLIQTLPNKTS